MFSCALVYWIFNNFAALVDNALPVLLTSLVFTLVSIVGFRIFHTYSGFMRYASFVDLMRVTYGNLINLGLALVADFLLQMLPVKVFAYYNTTSIFLIFILATLLMWALRVFVKTLYDVAFSNTRAMRVLVYGAMTGGVGLAKMIQNQRPRRYVVKGFITHYQKAKHSQILGETVYHVDEDLANIIKGNDI
jgi:FlaA1/EpsC-like NDP-sugar epimerase